MAVILTLLTVMLLGIAVARPHWLNGTIPADDMLVKLYLGPNQLDDLMNYGNGEFEPIGRVRRWCNSRGEYMKDWSYGVDGYGTFMSFMTEQDAVEFKLAMM